LVATVTIGTVPLVDRLAITSCTNFLLAAELFFFAGMMARTAKTRLTPAWFWAVAMTALAVSSLLGGLDHGLVEPAGLDRFWIQRPNWLVMGVMTFCTLQVAGRQFLPARLWRTLLVVGVVQAVVYAVAVFAIGNFLVVIANYAPVVLLLLVLSIRGLNTGTGSWQLVAGICVLLVATLVQVSGLDLFLPLDHDGLYHVISIAGVPLLYAGGQRLATV
jgi:hypothetical protein